MQLVEHALNYMPHGSRAPGRSIETYYLHKQHLRVDQTVQLTVTKPRLPQGTTGKVVSRYTPQRNAVNVSFPKEGITMALWIWDVRPAIVTEDDILNDYGIE